MVNIETQMLFSSDTYALDALINVTRKLLPCVWLIFYAAQGIISQKIKVPR